MRIVLEPDLTVRVSIEAGGQTAAVHLCEAPGCDLCPDQTPERVRAELEAAAVLADPDGEPDWVALAAAVDGVRHQLDKALCRRMVPDLGSSLGVSADSAETSDVLPALPLLQHRRPLAESLGNATTDLLARPLVPVRTPRVRGTDWAPATLPAPDATGPLPRSTDFLGVITPTDPPRPPRDRSGHGGWARTAVLAGALLVVGLGGGTAVQVTEPFGIRLPLTGPASSGRSDPLPVGESGGQQRDGRPATGQDGEPTPTPAPTSGVPAVVYSSCAAADIAGVSPILRGQPGYSAKLDADGDGIACEDPAGRTGAPSAGAQDPAAGGDVGEPSAEPAPAEPAEPTATGPAAPVEPPGPAPTQPDQPTMPVNPPPVEPAPTTPAAGECVLDVAGLCVLPQEQQP